jgi:alpha-L-rhamnosidase
LIFEFSAFLAVKSKSLGKGERKMKRIVLMTGMLFVGSMVVAKPLEYAKWISDGKPQPTSDEACYLEDPAPIFKKTFQIHKEECSVELHIAALGLYRAELNGKPVGNAVLAPLWTPFNERILVDTYDIKNLLVQGENTLTVTLGNGWYNPLPLRLWGHINVRANVAVGRPALAAEIELKGGSNHIMAFQTDGTWQVAETPLLRNNLYLGEVYDARRTIGEWRSVTIVTNPPKGVLERRSAPPVVEIATWPSVKVTPLEPQKQVVDMGRNFSGVATFRLGKGPAGERITFRYGELLNTNGTVNVMTAVCGQIKSKGKGGPGAPDIAEQHDIYIRSGAGDETYTPRFTWHVFRYVQVQGLSNALQPKDVIAHAWASDVKSALTFECNNPRVNALHTITRNTFLSNIMGVQSDCPGRERFGYGADIAVSAEAFILNFDMKEFYRKSLRDFADEAKGDGYFTETAPYVGIASEGFGGRSGPIGWSLGVPVVMAELLRYYGDTEIVAELYPACARYMGLMEKHAPDFIVKECIGDHEALEKPSTSLTATAHYYQFALLMNRFATLLNMPEDAARWKTLAGNIRNAFQAKFVQGAVVGKGRQADQAFGLYHNLIVPEKSAEAEALLRQALAAKEGAFSTGIYSTQYLLDLMPGAVEQNITKDTFPGWGYMLANGATTLWEVWKFSDNTFSHAHPMFGSVDSWIVKYLLGIRVADDAIGSDKLIVAPVKSPTVTDAKGEYQTVKGPVRVSWKMDGTKRHLEVEIPKGVTARVQPQPDGDWVEVQAGKHAW